MSGDVSRNHEMYVGKYLSRGSAAFCSQYNAQRVAQNYDLTLFFFNISVVNVTISMKF